jgi:hypothetical protein
MIYTLRNNSELKYIWSLLIHDNIDIVKKELPNLSEDVLNYLQSNVLTEVINCEATSVLKFLLEDGNFFTDTASALGTAIANGQYEYVKLLLKYVDTFSLSYDEKYYCLSDSIRYNYIKIFNLLLETISYSIKMLNELFIVACAHGSIDIVKKFLDIENLDLTSQNNAAFKSSLNHNHTNVTKVLLTDNRILSKLVLKDLSYEQKIVLSKIINITIFDMNLIENIFFKKS